MTSPTIDVPEIVARLATAIPADFAVVVNSRGERKGRCVEATRIAVAWLRRHRVEAGPLPCDIIALNAAARALGDGLADQANWTDDVWSVGIHVDSNAPAHSDTEPRRRSGYNGHLVVAGDGWFLDLTAPQLHRPDHGIVVARPMLGPYDPDQAGVECDLPDGGLVQWVWRREVARWRRTPAWRQDIPPGVFELLDEHVGAP